MRITFLQRTALVSARDYLMWLVELNGIKKGAVESVRELIDKAIAEDDAAPQYVGVRSIPIDDNMIANAKLAQKVGMTRVTMSVPVDWILGGTEDSGGEG